MADRGAAPAGPEREAAPWLKDIVNDLRHRELAKMAANHEVIGKKDAAAFLRWAFENVHYAAHAYQQALDDDPVPLDEAPGERPAEAPSEAALREAARAYWLSWERKHEPNEPEIKRPEPSEWWWTQCEKGLLAALAALRSGAAAPARKGE